MADFPIALTQAQDKGAVSGVCNVNGIAVSRVSGSSFLLITSGQIEIGVYPYNIVYDIESITDADNLILQASAGLRAGVYFTGVTILAAKHLNNLEEKLGVNGSLDPNTVDYVLRNPGSIDPGHQHSRPWIIVGSLAFPTFAEAVAALNAAGAPVLLILPEGVHAVSGVNLTANANIEVYPLPGADVQVAAGKVCTIYNLSPAIGNYKWITCFGTGKVIFPSAAKSSPFWWGMATTAADNAPFIRAAAYALPNGGSVEYKAQGVFICATSVFDGDQDVPNGLIFKGGGGWREDCYTAGCILKNTGANTLFKIYTPNTSDLFGRWFWEDQLIWSNPNPLAGGIQLNDMTLGHAGQAYIMGGGLRNVGLVGCGDAVAHTGGLGLAIAKGVDFRMDRSCLVRNWKRGAWLFDCDYCDIDGRFIYNNQHYRVECSTLPGGSSVFTNGNTVRGNSHYCMDYGDDRYVIWDRGYKTIYKEMQVEPVGVPGVSGDSPWFLGGWWTTFTDIKCTGTAKNAGYLDTTAKGIVFRNVSGMFATMTATAWPKIEVAAGYTPGTNYADRQVIFESCDMEFLRMIPGHPAFRFVGAKPAFFPSPAGHSGYEVYAHGGFRNAFNALEGEGRGSRGLGSLSGGACYGHAFSREFVGGNAGNASYTVPADADARLGYAIQLVNVNTTPAAQVGHAYKVGRDVNIGDTIRWSVKAKLSATPVTGCMKCYVYNMTKAAVITANDVGTGATTSYLTVRGSSLLTAANAAVGDIIQVYFYHNTDAVSARLMNIDHFFIDVVPKFTWVGGVVRQIQAVAYGTGTINIDLSLGPVVNVGSIGTNTALTVNNPTNMPLGLEWTLHLVNGLGACTITWGNAFKADAYVTLAASKARELNFRFDGTYHWLQGFDLTP